MFSADFIAVGMAFQSISDYNASPFFQTLVSEGTVSDSVFGFKLSSSGAELYLGGTDSDLVSGDFTYVSVAQEGYWQVDMDGLSVGGSQVVSSTSSIIDTGTTLIVGDSSSVASAYSSISGSSDNGDGTYTVDCDLVGPAPLLPALAVRPLARALRRHRPALHVRSPAHALDGDVVGPAAVLAAVARHALPRPHP